MDWRKALNQINSQVSNTYGQGREAMLDRMGLEPKRHSSDFILPAISIFSAGIVVGAALGVLFAPKRGQEVRGDIRHKLDDLRSRGNERYEELRQQQIDRLDG